MFLVRFGFLTTPLLSAACISVVFLVRYGLLTIPLLSAACISCANKVLLGDLGPVPVEVLRCFGKVFHWVDVLVQQGKRPVGRCDEKQTQ